MHSLIHLDFARATAMRSHERQRGGRRGRKAHPPPGRLRRLSARRLAWAAARIDRESARRAIA
jgi:hypothetical protein